VLQLPIAGQVKSSQGQAKGQANKWLDERRNALRLYYCRTLFCSGSWRGRQDMGRRARARTRGGGTMGEVRNGET
jgi:hypothetical protein